MVVETDGRKEKYYELALAKGNEIYSSWATSTTVSKRIVAKANEYAFDKRLKTDALYRFRVLAFMIALGIRLEKRYRTFFRKLFRIFAYIREQNALKMLKRVFRFDSNSDIRELIEIEVEKIKVLLSNRKNGQSTGGGHHFETGDIELDEEINVFFEECMREVEQKSAENNVDPDQEKQLDVRDELLLEKTEDTQREKISVEELGDVELGREKKTTSPTKIEQTEKETIKTMETGIDETKTKEKPVEKSVANTSILAEMTILAQDKEADLPSPFPVFKSNPESKPVFKSKEDFVLEKGKNQPQSAKENGEKLDKDIQVDAKQDKSPFPVFKGEKTGEIKPQEKTVEKEIKDVKEIKNVKDFEDYEYFDELQEINPTEKKSVRVQAEISEENKTRIALNTTMREEEIQAIVNQIKESAKMVMDREERVWREKISVADNANAPQSTSKIVENPQNNGAIKQDLKK